MLNLYVDPVILAVPENHCAEEEFEKYVNYIVEWADAIKAEREHFFVSWGCLDALSKAGCFPQMHTLDRLAATQRQPIDTYTISRLGAAITGRTPWLEEILPEVPDFYSESFFVDPDLLTRLPSVVAGALKKDLLTIAYSKAVHNSPKTASMFLITHPLNGKRDASIVAAVLTNDEMVEAEADLPMLTTVRDLDALTELETIWEEPEEAIAWTKRGLVSTGAPLSSQPLTAFAVAPSFVETIKHNSLKSRVSTIYDKCVRLLAGMIPAIESKNKGENHWLVYGADSNTQRDVDGWKAWRLYIGRSHRLHYWRKDEKYILMQVGHHNDFEIEDPPEELVLKLFPPEAQDR